MLTTTPNQFSFKEKLSSAMCIFLLKQVIEYYNFYNSPVYLCYLDASKVFDKINHWHLFYKLLHKNVPCIIVRLLITWYSCQKYVVGCPHVVQPLFMCQIVFHRGTFCCNLFSIYTWMNPYAVINCKLNY